MRWRDHLEDPGLHKLNWLRANYDLPSFVKEASFEEDRNVIMRHEFAYPENREFPMHTRADTWMSARLFQKHASEFPETTRNAVARRLLDACMFWDARGGEKPPVMQKQAAGAFAIRYSGEDGEQLAEVFVNTSDDLVKLAVDLSENKFKYPYKTRTAVASRILEAPEHLRQALPRNVRRSLEKTAGLQRTSVAEARRMTAIRAIAYRNKGRADLSDAVLSEFGKTAVEAINGVIPKQALAKFAGSVDGFDRLVRMHMHLGHSLRPAEDSWRGLTLYDIEEVGKEAATLPNGAIVVKEDIRRNPKVPQALQSLFGIEAGSDPFQKVAELTSDQCTTLLDVLHKDAPNTYSLERLHDR